MRKHFCRAWQCFEEKKVNSRVSLRRPTCLLFILKVAQHAENRTTCVHIYPLTWCERSKRAHVWHQCCTPYNMTVWSNVHRPPSRPRSTPTRCIELMLDLCSYNIVKYKFLQKYDPFRTFIIIFPIRLHNS